MGDQFVIKRRTVLEISCAFCNKAIREDEKSKADDPYDNQEYYFTDKVKRQNWSFRKLMDGHIINMCPDHSPAISGAIDGS